MKRLLILLLCVVAMSGCAQQSEVQPSVEAAISQVQEEASNLIPNMKKTYYQYYLPTDVGRSLSSDLGEVFQKNGMYFTMNLNSAYIIQNYYYEESIANAQQATAMLEGTYKNYLGRELPFVLGYQQLEDNVYYLTLDATIATFAAVVPMSEVDNIASAMMKIACSIKYELKLILNDFSAKQLIQESEKIDLDKYNNAVPDSGYLSELVGD
ncbi:MAG: hypothetical protein ACRCZJ_01175 [Erysipelotrichaceae bacterium]